MKLLRVLASHERVEDDDGLIQVPDENAVQVRFGIRWRIWLSPISIAATPRTSFRMMKLYKRINYLFIYFLLSFNKNKKISIWIDTENQRVFFFKGVVFFHAWREHLNSNETHLSSTFVVQLDPSQASARRNVRFSFPPIYFGFFQKLIWKPDDDSG